MGVEYNHKICIKNNNTNKDIKIYVDMDDILFFEYEEIIGNENSDYETDNNIMIKEFFNYLENKSRFYSESALEDIKKLNIKLIELSKKIKTLETENKTLIDFKNTISSCLSK